MSLEFFNDVFSCVIGGLPDSSPTRPEWCLFGKVNDNMETILFKEKFIDWPDSSRLIQVKEDDDKKVCRFNINKNKDIEC